MEYSSKIEKTKDLMLLLLLGLNKTIDWLAMVNSAHWYGHVLRREDSCLEKGNGFGGRS